MTLSTVSSKKKTVRLCLGIAALLCLCLVAFLVISNVWMMAEEGKRIVEADTLEHGEAYDCILILGAGVKNDGTPSDILIDRLKVGLSLYRAGAAPKILVSGDHGRVGYDEVNTMKSYLMEAGVPSEDIFMDHAGFSTYESLVRAQKVFGVKKLILVTQTYHLYRSLYVAKQLGMESVGVSADLRAYKRETYRNFREWLARDKDIFYCLFSVEPTYLGEPIDIHGDGNLTND